MCHRQADEHMQTAAGKALVDRPVVRNLVSGRMMWEMRLDREAGTQSAKLVEAMS